MRRPEVGEEPALEGAAGRWKGGSRSVRESGMQDPGEPWRAADSQQAVAKLGLCFRKRPCCPAGSRQRGRARGQKSLDLSWEQCGGCGLQGRGGVGRGYW